MIYEPICLAMRLSASNMHRKVNLGFSASFSEKLHSISGAILLKVISMWHESLPCQHLSSSSYPFLTSSARPCCPPYAVFRKILVPVLILELSTCLNLHRERSDMYLSDPQRHQSRTISLSNSVRAHITALTLSLQVGHPHEDTIT